MGYLVRLAFIIGAAALFAGCGGQQPSMGVPDAMPQSGTAPRHSDRGGSWMLPGASGEALIYAVSGCPQSSHFGTCVLSYPKGKLVGELDTAGAAVCSDSQGNVFIPIDNTVTEYAHAGTYPIQTLSLPGDQAAGCAVDPVTNNLAVLYDGSGKNVAIFPNESGTPILYAAKIDFQYCGYDNSGDLFVDGLTFNSSGGHSSLAELPIGGSDFSNISISDSVGSPGQLQWDGKYITYEGVDQGNVKLSRLSISGSQATIIGTTKLTLHSVARASWLFGNRVIVPHPARRHLRAYSNQISFFKYPEGGTPLKTIKRVGDFTKLQLNFQGVTISVAPSR